MSSKYKIGVTVVLGILLIIGIGFVIDKLNTSHSSIVDKFKKRIFQRVDVERLYEETPFIFEAGKQLTMFTPSKETQLEIENLYLQIDTIESAIEGDGGIIKNRNATVFPYDFHFQLYDYLYTKEINIHAKERVRVAVLGELDAEQQSDEVYFDVILYVDNISCGIRRFEAGKWGYSDWFDVPAGKLKLVLVNTNPNKITGFGAVFVGE